MRKTTTFMLGCAVLGTVVGHTQAAAPVPFANTLYSSDFETDQSGVWTVDSNPGSNPGNESVDHTFAYSGLDGISGTGVKVIANSNSPVSTGSNSAQTTLDISTLTGGAITEITGSYQIEVDVWMSYSRNGPGAGTSEHAYVGVNTTPGIAASYFSGNTVSGTYLFHTVDGDVGSDIILRDSITPNDGLTTMSDPDLGASYTYGVDPETVGNGAVINGWATFTIQYNADADTLNFWIDGAEIPFEDPIFFDPLNQDVVNTSGVTSGSVSLGLFDAGSGSSDFPEDQFVIYDNVVITTETDLLAGSLPGDLNNDGFVGLDDLDIVLSNWNLTVPPADPRADPSGDNYVGLEDLDYVLIPWNTGTPPTSVVPEPTSLALLGLGTCALLRRR